MKKLIFVHLQSGRQVVLIERFLVYTIQQNQNKTKKTLKSILIPGCDAIKQEKHQGVHVESLNLLAEATRFGGFYA